MKSLHFCYEWSPAFENVVATNPRWKINLHVGFDETRSTTKFILYILPYVCVSVLSLFEQRGRCESRFVSPMKMHKSYYVYIPSLHKQILKTLSFWCWWLFNLSKLFNSFNEMMCMICAFIRVFCIFWHI